MDRLKRLGVIAALGLSSFLLSGSDAYSLQSIPQPKRADYSNMAEIYSNENDELALVTDENPSDLEKILAHDHHYGLPETRKNIDALKDYQHFRNQFQQDGTYKRLSDYFDTIPDYVPFREPQYIGSAVRKGANKGVVARTNGTNFIEVSSDFVEKAEQIALQEGIPSEHLDVIIKYLEAHEIAHTSQKRYVSTKEAEMDAEKTVANFLDAEAEFWARKGKNSYALSHQKIANYAQKRYQLHKSGSFPGYDDSADGHALKLVYVPETLLKPLGNGQGIKGKYNPLTDTITKHYEVVRHQYQQEGFSKQ